MRALRTILATFFWTVFSVAALALSVYVHVQSPRGREVTRQILNSFISGEVRGELRIGRIDQLSPRSAIARHTILFDPQGRKVAVADEAVVTFDLSALPRGLLRFPKIRGRGLTVALYEGADGDPSFIDALGPARPSRPGSGPGLHVIVDEVTVDDGIVHGDILGLKGLRAERVRAIGRLEAQESFEVRIRAAQGVVVRPFPFRGYVDGLQGIIDTDEHKGIRIHARAHKDSERARVDVSYALRPGAAKTTKPRLNLRVHAYPISARTLEGLGFDWASIFDTEVRGFFSLTGPVRDLRLAADLDSDAGPLSVRGHILAEHEVVVRAETPSTTLDKLFKKAPNVTVGGTAVLSIDNQPGHDPTPRVRVDAKPFEFDRFTVPALAAELRINPTVVLVRHVYATRMKGALSANGSVTNDGKVDMRVRARIPSIEGDPNMRRQVPGARGSVEGDVRIGMSLGEDPTIHFRGDVHLRNFQYGLLRAESLFLTGYAHGVITQPKVDLKVLGEGVALGDYLVGHADVSLQGGPASYVAIGRFAAPGARKVAFDAKILASKREYVLNADRIEFSVGDLLWRGSIQNLKFQPGRELAADRIQLASGTQRFEVRGAYRFAGADELDAELQDFDLKGLKALLGPTATTVTGRLDAHVVLREDISSPNLVVSGALRQGAIRDLGDITASYIVRYDDGNLDVDGAADIGELGSVALTGSGRLNERVSDPVQALRTGTYDLTLDARDLDFRIGRQLRLAGMPPIDGKLTGQIVGRGTLEKPAFAVDLRAIPFVLPSFSPVQVALKGDYAATGTHVETFSVRDEVGSLLDSEGAIAADLRLLLDDPSTFFPLLTTASWHASLRLHPRDLAQYPQPLRFFLPPDVHAGLELSTRGGIEGLSASLNATGHWINDVARSDCARGVRPSAQLQATLAYGSTHASLVGFVGGRPTFTAKASAPTPIESWLRARQLPTSTPTTIEGRISRTTMEQVPWLCEFGSGPLGATLEVRDLFGVEPTVRVAVSSDALKLRYRSDRDTRAETLPFAVRAVATSNGPRQVKASVLTWNAEGKATRCGTTLRSHAREERVRCGDVTGNVRRSACVTGSIPVRWDAEHPVPGLDPNRPIVAELELRSAVLEPLLAMIPELAEADGLATGSVRAVVRGNQTNLSGRLRVDEGCAQLVGLGSHLTGVRGEFDFRGARAYIDKRAPLRANDGDGTIAVTGPVEFSGLRPSWMQLQVDAQQFPVRSEGAVLASLTGAGDLSARFGSSRADSKLRIDTLTVRLPDEGKQAIQELEPHDDVEVEGQPTEIPDQDNSYPLHVVVDAAKPFWVQRNDFSVQVAGALDVVYISPDLLVRGYIDMRRGFFEIFGKRLEIQRGSLTFDGQADLNPVVDLMATYAPRGQSDTITVTVGGHLKSPTIDFASSNPSITDRSEIIALLVSGRRNIGTQRASTTQGDEQAVGQQATSFLAGLTAGLLTAEARKQFGDIVPIIAIESGQAAFQSVRARVGWSLDSVIQKHLGFLAGVVQGGYIEGFGSGSSAAGGSAETQGAATRAVFGGLLELYFPYSFVGSVLFSPPNNWGVDVTWEP